MVNILSKVSCSVSDINCFLTSLLYSPLYLSLFPSARINSTRLFSCPTIYIRNSFSPSLARDIQAIFGIVNFDSKQIISSKPTQIWLRTAKFMKGYVKNWICKQILAPKSVFSSFESTEFLNFTDLTTNEYIDILLTLSILFIRISTFIECGICFDKHS